MSPFCGSQLFRRFAGLFSLPAFASCLAWTLGLVMAVGPFACKSDAPNKTAKDRGAPPAAGEKAQADPAKTNQGVAMPKEQVPPAKELFAAHVQAAGGQAAIDKIQSIYTEASLDVKAQALKGKVKSWWKEGQFYIEESVEGVGVMRAGYDGTHYWSDDPISQLRELSGPEAEQHAWASSMFLAAQWQDFFESAKSLGARKVGGSVLYDVELTTKGQEKLRVSFDKQSKLMVEQSFDQITAMDKAPITVRLSDYRVVGGYKFPHRQELQTPLLSGVQVYQVFKVNPKVPKNRFAMPSEHEIVPTDPQAQQAAKAKKRR